jgi:hypothetical protein
MEKALNIWIEDLSQRNIPLSTKIICNKAKKLYDHFALDDELNLDEANFLASKGWFERFKKRYNLHNVKLVGESASADCEAAKKFVVDFQKILNDEEYLPEQVFNADETGLNWKKMPTRTFISKDEKKASGYKVVKERLTLLFCGNASGDKFLKPMLIYKSENPRALKGKDKNKLPVYWRSKKRRG